MPTADDAVVEASKRRHDDAMAAPQARPRVRRRRPTSHPNSAARKSFPVRRLHRRRRAATRRLPLFVVIAAVVFVVSALLTPNRCHALSTASLRLARPSSSSFAAASSSSALRAVSPKKKIPYVPSIPPPPRPPDAKTPTGKDHNRATAGRRRTYVAAAAPPPAATAVASKEANQRALLVARIHSESVSRRRAKEARRESDQRKLLEARLSLERARAAADVSASTGKEDKDSDDDDDDIESDDWPLTLYEELYEMNQAAQMAYFISDLRKLASGGKLKESDGILARKRGSAGREQDAQGGSVIGKDNAEALRAQGAASQAQWTQGGGGSGSGSGEDDVKGAPPSSSRTEYAVMQHKLTTGEILKFIDDNYDDLRREMGGGGNDDDGLGNSAALSALRSIHERKDDAVTLEEFDDHMEEKRLVFCVAKDRNRKRITIMVRGSIATGTRDWYRNWQFKGSKMDTPEWMVPMMKRKNKHLTVHQGFYEYLFENTDLEGDRPRQRIEDIRDNVVSSLIRQSKGYKIYITGHSLGGALATLVAFKAAASTVYDIPQPITLVTFGAPYVGSAEFREAFQILEREGYIRYLRVTNFQDGVPCLFPFTPTLQPYKHVGVHLKLFGERNKVEISYPKVGGGPLGEVMRGWKNSILYNLFGPHTFDLKECHSPAEYNRRIELQKEVLAGEEPLKLNNLYRDKKLVGNLCSKLGTKQQGEKKAKMI